MLPYKVNDRVNIRFDSGDFIQAMITKIEGEQYLCVALSVGGGYKQGDKLYCTPEQMNRTSRLMSVVSHYVLADRVDFLREQFVKKFIKKQKAEDYETVLADFNYGKNNEKHINYFTTDFTTDDRLDSKKFNDWWMKEKYPHYEHKANNTFTLLSHLDTSPNKQYLGWVCKIWLDDKLMGEDFHKTKMYLTELFKLKLAGKVQGFDINTISSVPELYDVIKKDAGLGGFGILGLAQNETEEQILNEHATKVWENENWIVFTPDTYEASCILGEGTSWCTATKDYPNQYKSHTAKGKLWIAINKQNPQLKFQYHFETNQFKNTSDREVDRNKMREEYPDLIEGLFGTVEKHYTSGEGEDSLINYVNYIDKSRGGSVISKEKILEIIKKNTVVDKRGKPHVNLNFNNETVDFIYKLIPEILTDDLANRFIASKQVTDIDTITDLFENRKINPKSYEDVWEGNPEINFYDTHDPDREGSRDTAIITALLESGKLGKETLLTIIRKQRGSNSIENKHILAIKGRLAKLLTDEEVNKILPEDYQYHNGRPYIMFPEGLWETDVLDDFMSDDFRNAFKYYKDNGFYDIYADFGDSGQSYDDLLDDISPELSKQIQYYVKYKVDKEEDKDDNIDYDDIDIALEEFSYELDELKDAMEGGWSRAYETGYGDAVWDKIYKSIYGYFDGELKDKNGMVIGVCSDVTDIDDWESLYVGEYGSIISVMSGEADSKIDADFDYIYGDVDEYLNEEIENAIYEDVKDWEEVIATMPKEKKKKTTKPKTIKPKKVGGKEEDRINRLKTHKEFLIEMIQKHEDNWRKDPVNNEGDYWNGVECEKELKEINEELDSYLESKKTSGILNMDNILSEYIGEKTALDYRMGDEPQLFENTNKGVVFVGGDLMGVNIEGVREPYSIDWLQANKMWAVRQLQGATKLKNLALKGVDVIVFVAYKKLLGGMQSNPAFQNGVDRAIIEKLSEQGLTVDEVVEKIGGEGLSDTQLQSKILKYLGLSKEQIAKDLAMDNYKDYIGKIVGVAKFSGIHTNEHRTIEHQVYPVNIILENYTEINPPLDFEEFAKDSGISNKSLWLRLRSFALTMNVNNNPAISYLYDTADANDHFAEVSKKVANKNNIDMNKIKKTSLNIKNMKFYHSTPIKNLQNILKNGLDPAKSINSSGQGLSIYLTNVLDVANQYTLMNDCTCAILEIDGKYLDESLFLPDDYELQDCIDDGGWGRYDRLIRQYDYWEDVPYELSLKAVQQVQYTSIIPPDAIKYLGYNEPNNLKIKKDKKYMNKINKIRAIKEELIDTFDIKGVKKTAKRFPYVFDKHQPQYIFDRITGKMILDEEQLNKVGGYKWRPNKQQREEFKRRMQDPEEKKMYEDRQREKRKYDNWKDKDFVPTENQYNLCKNLRTLKLTPEQEDAIMMVESAYINNEKVNHNYIHVVNQLGRDNGWDGFSFGMKKQAGDREIK